MTKQLVNLVGAVATIGILAAGILLFALPQFTASQQLASDAATVEQGNAVQQSVLDALTAQSADMTALEADVAALREVVPITVRADDIVLLAAEAAAQHGGTVRSVTVGTAEPFTARTGAEAAAPAPAAVTESSAASADSDPAAAPDAAAIDAAVAEAAAADGPQQVSLTLSVGAADRAAATAIVDALRSGPRAVAITQASVTTGDDGATAEITLLAFYTPS